MLNRLRNSRSGLAAIAAASTIAGVTATTEGDKAGASILELQKYLGHADPRTTIGYIRSQQNLDKSPAYIIRYG